jgi:voltage-gated sodium channel
MRSADNDPELQLAGGHAGEPVAGWRGRLLEFVEGPGFRTTVVIVIILNAVVLGLQTTEELKGRHLSLLHSLDDFALGFFCIELTLRIVAHRGAFFRDGWSVFDFVVVAVALLPVGGDLEIFRVLRVLRIMRLLTAIPRLRSVVSAMLSALPGMNAALILLAVVFYMFSVITTKLFGEQFPGLFGSIEDSLFTLFQIMTLESWASGIVRPVMQLHAHAPLVFVPFILLTAYGIVNLFVAMVVAAMSKVSQEEAEEQDAMMQDLAQEVRHLRDEIRQLRDDRDRR